LEAQANVMIYLFEIAAQTILHKTPTMAAPTCWRSPFHLAKRLKVQITPILCIN